MTIPSSPELEALQALTESEGWRLLMAWYDKEWGPSAFAAKVSRAIGGNLPEVDAVRTLQQTTVARAAVEGMKDWPDRRLSELRRQYRDAVLGPNPSRRGPGL